MGSRRAHSITVGGPSPLRLVTLVRLLAFFRRARAFAFSPGPGFRWSKPLDLGGRTNPYESGEHVLRRRAAICLLLLPHGKGSRPIR